MPTLAATFTGLDWAVLGAYFLLLLATGVWFSRREQKTTEDYFLGGRRMPVWAVAVSIVATSMSAASFIGVPESGYRGDLTYLSTNIGMVLAALVIAFVFIPAFYREGVETIYGLLGRRFGEPAKAAASWAFMIGRVMASGARIYIGALPASLVLFGVERGMEPGNIVVAIAAMTAVGIVYTLVGGVASVIWTDVIQLVVFLGACIGAIILILVRIDAPAGQVIDALATGGPDGGSKLAVFDFRMDPSLPFTVLTATIGFTLLGIGSYGTDQDLAQRMLTCRSAVKGSRSVVAGILLMIPSIALFLVAGLLLWVFYQRPELIGRPPAEPPSDARKVFLEFILREMPAGLTGLMMAGLFAAGLSSLNSAINAMSSTFVADFYRRVRSDREPRHYVVVGRLGVVGWGLVLGAFACVCAFWQDAARGGVRGGDLLDLALGVMTFAYAGLVGVFLTALLTRRGNSGSAIAALVIGFALVGVMQKVFWGSPAEGADAGWWGGVVSMHFSWKLTVATVVSFLVCASGAPRRGAYR